MSEPVKISYEIINASSDIQCMNVFVEALKIMDDAPDQHKKTALNWMKEIIDARLVNVEPF